MAGHSRFDDLPALPGKPWHHTAKGFRNPPGSPRQQTEMLKYLGFVTKLATRAFDRVEIPQGHVWSREMTENGLAEFADHPSITWLGHASFLIRIGGKTIITDPYLTTYAGPRRGLGAPRFVECPIPVAELPEVDLLLLSHNHFDHLDENALDQWRHKSKTTAISPLGLSPYFTKRGFAKAYELDWYQHRVEQGINITCLPAVHWSRRSMFDTNRTLWGSFVIEAAGRKLFYCCDTAYGPIYPELGQKYGPFDLAMVPIGAYDPQWMMHASHTTPEEAVRIGRDLKARQLVAMHWGTVVLSEEPPFEPPVRFQNAGLHHGFAADQCWVMKIGETRYLPGGNL